MARCLQTRAKRRFWDLGALVGLRRWLSPPPVSGKLITLLVRQCDVKDFNDNSTPMQRFVPSCCAEGGREGVYSFTWFCVLGCPSRADCFLLLFLVEILAVPTILPTAMGPCAAAHQETPQT